MSENVEELVQQFNKMLMDEKLTVDEAVQSISFLLTQLTSSEKEKLRQLLS